MIAFFCRLCIDPGDQPEDLHRTYEGDDDSQALVFTADTWFYVTFCLYTMSSIIVNLVDAFATTSPFSRIVWYNTWKWRSYRCAFHMILSEIGRSFIGVGFGVASRVAQMRASLRLTWGCGQSIRNGIIFVPSAIAAVNNLPRWHSCEMGWMHSLRFCVLCLYIAMCISIRC